MGNMPHLLKNFGAYVDGVGLTGEIEEAELPAVEIKLEGYRGGGMDAESMMDMGTEPMEAKLTLGGPNPELIKALGNGTHVQLRGHFVRDHDNSRLAVIAEIGGRFKKVAPGSWKAGEKAPFEHEVTLDYYRLTVGGEEMWEIDILNSKRVIGGVDQLADMRASLGI